MEPVKYSKEESSLVASIQYAEDTWTLDVLLHNGGGYSYSDVPPEVYAAFLGSTSKGGFYNKEVKGHFNSLNHKDLPAEMPDSKTIEGEFQEQLKASVAAEPERDPSWPPEDVMDVIMGNDALEVPGGTLGVAGGPDIKVVAPEALALVTVAPVQEVMAKLASVSSQLAVLNAKSESFIKRSFVVTDRPTYDEVQNTVKAIKAHGAEIVSVIDPVRDVFYRAYSAVQEKQKAAVEPLNLAMKTANAALNAYDAVKEAEARERQRIADKAAADAAEAARKAESERLTLAAVDDHLQVGDTAAAERLFAEPIEAPAQPVYAERTYSEAPSPKGVSKRKNWKAEITDIVELILDVAEGIKYARENGGNLGGHAPATFLEVDMVAVNQACKALEANAKFPGVRAFNESVRSTRA